MDIGVGAPMPPVPGAVPTRAAIARVAKGFEAYFAGELVKSMRGSSQPDKLTGGGRGEDTLNVLLNQAYADAIASRGGLGIARLVEKQLNGGVYVENRKQKQDDPRTGGACPGCAAD